MDHPDEPGGDGVEMIALKGGAVCHDLVLRQAQDEVYCWLDEVYCWLDEVYCWLDEAYGNSG